MRHRYSRALITGVGGQDGAFLAAQLLGEGVVVCGTHRPSSPRGNWRLAELGIDQHPRLQLHALDTGDAAACRELVAAFAPQAIFHLAGQSRVADSFRDPVGSLHANGVGTVNLLEAMRRAAPNARAVYLSNVASQATAP